MTRVRCFVVCLVVLGLACGKSSEKKAEGDSSRAKADSSSSVVAAALAAKGFVVVNERPAPSQRSSRKASLVVYRSPDGARGGVVYLTRPLDIPEENIGWHWYFADAAPDSAALLEINRDGLWDARVYFAGRSMDMIQGESFSLLGRGREGSEALNGASTAPADLWKCFDGDSATAWRSPAKDAFIELPVPLGVTQAQLDVQLSDRNRPEKLGVYAGERKLQTIQLSDGTARQSFALDPAVRDASSLRLVVEGAAADSVAISELEIR